MNEIRRNDIRQLRSALSMLRLAGRHPAAITVALTNAIELWASERGWTAIREYDLPGYTREGSNRGGRLDLYVQMPNGLGIAIEVDRYDREKSLDKLAFCVAQGELAIWVRWCNEGSASLLSVPPGVELIEVDIGAKPARVGWVPKPAIRPQTSGSQARAHRAYSPWSDAEERQLKQLYQRDAPIQLIARLLGRRPGAIRSRLRKRGFSY